MKVTSSAFKHKRKIPARFTQKGENLSPPLAWIQVPRDTRSFALICEDPDAPNVQDSDYPFVHWVLYNLPPTITVLPEGIPQQELLTAPFSAAQGRNSYGHPGYDGPFPPAGSGTHRYIFRLYALDADLELKPLLGKHALLQAIAGHVLESAELIGTFERKAERKAA